MDKFLKTQNLPRLRKKIENLNRPLTSKETADAKS